MLIEEREYVCSTLSIRIDDGKQRDHDAFPQPRVVRVEGDGGADVCGHLFEFVENAPATFAERFPRLTFCAVAVALLLAAISTEIEYLRGSGYYWP